jgi:polyphosphate kinase
MAGVQIDLLIRGICCLRPGVEGVSDNIRVVSIVGRFLEHSRIYYFHNAGDPALYVGSADLMPRNIDRRVEVMFPIEEEQMRRRLVEEILEVYLQDTAKMWQLQADGSYLPPVTPEEGKVAFNSQIWFLNGHESELPDEPTMLVRPTAQPQTTP